MKKTEQINLRLTDEMVLDVHALSDVEGVDRAELIRGLIRDKIQASQKNKRFLARRAELIKKQQDEAAGA